MLLARIPRGIVRASLLSFLISTGVLDAQTGAITTVVGGGTLTQLSIPSGLAVGVDGSLYIADGGNNIVRKLSNGTISTVAGNGTQGFSGDGGTATAAELHFPVAVAVAADGTLYIADWMSNRIRKVRPDGVISTLAGDGVLGYSGDGGPATAAQLASPSGLAVAADGTLYIADGGNGVIRKVGANGIISTFAGNGTQGFGGDGGPATSAMLQYPNGLALGPDGSLYIADTYNCAIRKVGTDGIISTVAGIGGACGFSGDGVQGTAAQLASPVGVTVAPDGSLYISDSGNNRIRKVGTGSVVSTVAGNGTEGFSGDGGPTGAELDYPEGLALAADGSLYIADSRNARIRKVVFGVTSLPNITLSPRALNFIATVGGPAPPSQQVTVGSTSDPLSFFFTQSVASGGNWLNANQIGGTTTPGRLVATVSTVGLAAGSYSGTLTVIAAKAGNSPQIIPVNLTVNPAQAQLAGIQIVSGNHQTTLPGQLFPVPLVVKVVDGAGNGVSRAVMSWSVTTGSATLSSVATSTDVNGLASAIVTAGLGSGLIVVQVQTGTLSVQFELTSNSPGPNVSSAGIFNAASDVPGLTPCGAAIIAGTNIAPGVSGTIQAMGAPYPATLAGVSVQIGDILAPITSVSNVGGQQQVKIQTPCEAPVGTATVTVIAPTGSATVTGVQTLPYQPGIFQISATDGKTYAYASRPDGSLIGPSNPAVAGETIRVFVTGLGQTNPPIVTDAAGMSGQAVVAHIIGGVNNGGVPVIDAGYATDQIGLYFVDMTIPVDTQTGPYQPIAVAVLPADGGALIFSNSTYIPIQAAPISLPTITASPSQQINFTAPVGGPAPASQQITIGSSGATLSFTVTGSTNAGSWLQVTSSSATTPATLTVTCDPTGLAAGTYSGTVAIAATVSNSPLTINVNLNVLAVTPPQLSLTATQGASAIGSVQLDGSAQSVSITTDRPWLFVNPNQGTPSVPLNVTAVSTGLAPGTYNGNVLVGGSPLVPVSLTVTPPAPNATLVTNVLSAGLQFQVFAGQPGAPALQTINITSSDGSVLNYTANVNYPSGNNGWVSLSSRSGQTPGSLDVGVQLAALSQSGTYSAQLVLSAAGPTITIPLTLSYTQPPPSQIQVNLQELKISTAGTPQNRSLIVSNPGPGVLPFNASSQTDDGNNWLTVNPPGGSTNDQQPDVLQVTTDPAGLAAGTYTGSIQIQATNQTPLIVPVYFAVGANTALYSADTALNWSVGSNFTSFPAQNLELIASGSAPVNWQAKSSVKWLTLKPASGQIQPSTIGVTQINVDLSQLVVGNNNGTITISSDSSTGPLTIPVVVQVLPPSYPVVRVEPTGIAFVAPAFPTQTAAFIASSNGKVIVSTNQPWLTASDSSKDLVQLPLHSLTININSGQLPQGVAENRGTVTIQDPTGTSRTISVLVYVPSTNGPGSTSRAAQAVAAAVCTPSRFIPLFTSLLPSFEQTGGATSTEIVMIDDCGNPVTSGVTGGVASNGDPQLELRSLLDGRWKATWNPVASNPFVALSVVGADPTNPSNPIYPSAPVQALASIISAPTAPALDKVEPFKTGAGVRLPVVAPNLQFQINGQNFLNPDGSGPQVTIGGEQLQIVSATSTQLVVVTPGDLPPNVEMQLVIQRTSDGAVSVPEPVIIAPVWPVLAAPPSGNSLLITGFGRSSPPVEVEGVRVKSTRRVSAGLWCVELERPLLGPRPSRLRIVSRTAASKAN